MHSSSGSGHDDSVSTSSAPYFYSFGEPVGNRTTTSTRDHIASETNHRDFNTRDRHDWRFDSATGQLVPTRRVQNHNHVIDVSLDVTYDTDVNSEFEGSYTVPTAWYASTPRTHEFDGTSQRHTRETFASGQNSSRTTTSTTPLEGAGAGEAIVLVTGSDAVSHSSYARSDSHSSFYNEEVNGSDGYFFQQSSTDDYSRSTFDSHRSTQRIDGTGDTHYQGNRTLSGNGWMSHWTLRQYEEFEPEQGSDHMPLFPEDDRPDSYDVTLGNSFEASADTPIAYGYSTNPPVNTAPGGSLGPGSFSPPEDSQSIISFFGDVAMAGSTALMDHAARDAAFAELATEREPSSDMADPDCEAIDTTETGPEAMRRYAEGQGALPTQEIPEAIRIEIANGEDMWIINPDQLTNPPTVTDDGLCPATCGCNPDEAILEDGGLCNESGGENPGAEDGPGGDYPFPAIPKLPFGPLHLVSDPGDNSTLLERFIRNARNRGVPEGQMRGIMGPDVVLDSGELKGGLSRMLDGNHVHGSIRANEVAIAGINYAGITAREAVLLVFGAKGAEYGLQAGNFLLMRTRAGLWVVKQGERAIILTKDQVTKLRQVIRNGTKGGDKLTDAQVDLLLAPKWTVSFTNQMLARSETMYKGSRIHKIDELVAKFGGTKNGWLKKKGWDAQGKEWHWYEHHGIGRIGVKPPGFPDPF